MVAHDVSRELRGEHGKWTKGAALERVIKSARGPADHKAKIDELTPGKSRGVNGILVAHAGDKGYKVRLPGSTKFYKSSGEAAVAVHRKEHHDEGHSPIPVPGGKPESKAPAYEGPAYKPESAASKRAASVAAGKRQASELAGYTLTGETRQAYGTTQHAVLRPNGRSIEWADEGSALHRAAEKQTPAGSKPADAAKEWRQSKLREIGHVPKTEPGTEEDLRRRLKDARSRAAETGDAIQRRRAAALEKQLNEERDFQAKSGGATSRTPREPVPNVSKAAHAAAMARQGTAGKPKSLSLLRVGDKATYPGGHTVVRTGSGGGPTGFQATIAGKSKFYTNNQQALLAVALRHGSH
jgi:hypothetical protein